MISHGDNQENVVYVRDFTATPGPRLKEDGKHSGQEFRDKYLVPRFRNAIEKGLRLTVVLDGTKGYASSFLEEAFGGLVRANFTKQQVTDHLLIVSSERPWYEPEVQEYIAEAA